MGRSASGVRAITLIKGDKVVGAVAIKRRTTSILIVTEHGFGKRSGLDEYPQKHRGGRGVITLRVTDKTGKMIGIKEVTETDDIVVVTSKGVIIRQPAKAIRMIGRISQGVRLIRLEPGDQVGDVAVVPSEEDKEETKEETKEPAADQPGEEGKESPQPSLFEPAVTAEGKPPAGKAKGGKAEKKPAASKAGKRKSVGKAKKK
jgi:DNA gyrase subunit A